MKAVNLRTEYLTNPIGLGTKTPRLFWKLDVGAEGDGTGQSAYQIVAVRDGKEVWNTGKVASSRMTHVPYAGEPLKSRDHVDYTVTLWDENDIAGEPAEGSFELGLLQPSDWTAQWITGDYKPAKNTRYPVDCFRKDFRVESGLTKARLYITACGVYEAYIGGQRVGDFCLAPGSTDYRKRLQYQTYDVTALLTGSATDGTAASAGATDAKETALEVFLADGWYRGSIGCFAPTNVFGRQTRLLSQLELTYEGGKTQTIVSDGSWRWSNDGPVRFADLEDGEIVDAGMTPSYCGGAKAVKVKAKEAVTPTASDSVPVTRHERLAGKLITTPSGKTVADFGQNLAGFVSFCLDGVKGKKIRLTMGEILDENGEFTQKNMQETTTVKEMSQLHQILLITGNKEKLRCETKQTPAQVVEYICKGGRETYETRFAVFGFRYALIETDIDLAAANARFESVAVYSDMAVTGTFECSDEKVNRLWNNTLWSMKSNYLDVPTDCPTRERLGWTGDAQIFFRTGAYMMDTAAFMRKWLRDMQDNQFKNGKISAVLPYNGCSMVYDNTGASVGWCDAAILVPYRYYEAYGDIDLLRECYPMMKRYAEFMIANTGHKDKKAAKADPLNRYVYEKGMHLGEWLEPEEFNEAVTAGSNTLHTEEATAYLHYSMDHMRRAAEVLGYAEDAARYGEYADGAAKAYSALFLKGTAPDTDREAKLVRPLAMGIGTPEERKALQERLVKAAENRDYCVMTGFLSTPYILPVLTEAGESGTAYRMLLNDKRPGWLYEVNQGATTIWENWEGTLSQNHYSPGAVCQWLMESAAGIRQTSVAAFELAPVPANEGITWAKGSYESLYGKVESGWKVLPDGTVVYRFTIPAGVTATVKLPGKEPEVLGAGVYDRVG